MTKVHTVVVILQATPGKECELKDALIKVAAHSRAENTCLTYKVHQDNADPTQFILYENWESKEAHQKQFDKAYLHEFVKQVEDVLAKPYEAYFAEELI